jgi:hypothetical protein
MRLEADGVFQYKRIIFVDHDFGGLVVQKLLLMNRNRVTTVRAIVNYGTPSTGSGFFRLATLVSSNKQLLAMRTEEELEHLESSWRAIGSTIPVFCAYATLPTLGTVVVDRESATAGCTQIFPLNSNQADLVKPCDSRSDAYILLANVINKTSNDSH